MSGEMMTFPKTWEEYEKYWGFNDSNEVYTNNARLIPSFRVKQWLDHIKEAEPKKGKWVDIVEMDSGGYPFKVGVCCSVCGVPTLSDDNYCPYCGAKMEVSE